jgi:hypothetical protein
MHSLLDVLRGRGWIVRVTEPQRMILPATVAARYAGMPEEVLRFLGTLEVCYSADETTWFLASQDYSPTGERRYRWNEVELMAMGFAAGNADEQAEIVAFWNQHFPFMLAVHSDYDYLAVRIDDGAVVHGFAPEWESPTVVARSFCDFVVQFEVEATAVAPRWPYAVFLGNAA